MSFNSFDSLKSLKKTVAAFAGIIKIIDGDNLVLGGSNALKLHGLDLGREPSDIDLIIYRPTVEQQRFLELTQKTNGQRKSEFDNPEYKFRVTKFKSPKGNFNLDVIVSEEEIPQNLLSIDILENRFKIQSVSNIIKAKTGYFHKVDGRGSNKFIAQKDARDLQNLKILNFNL
jgi:hypothetical protein